MYFCCPAGDDALRLIRDSVLIEWAEDGLRLGESLATLGREILYRWTGDWLLLGREHVTDDAVCIDTKASSTSYLPQVGPDLIFQC